MFFKSDISYNEWNEINDIIDESERIKKIENERAYPNESEKESNGAKMDEVTE